MTISTKEIAIVICSGGLDSTTLVYLLKERYDVKMLSFDYGQRHKKELTYAAKTASVLHLDHRIIDLSVIANLLGGSSLTTDSIPVPDGHYTHESMKITVVPNRNAIMLSIAYGWAISLQATVVAFGIHSGDHVIYPDCRPKFFDLFRIMERAATAGFGQVDLFAPFIHWTKSDIVKTGHELGVPFEDTWSCYKGGKWHCGTCGTCVERREAFSLAEIEDPTEYELKGASAKI